MEDPEIHKKILELLEKGFHDPNSLTASDKSFLRARAGYIKQKHQDRLPSVFGGQAKTKETPKEEKKEARRPGRPPKSERMQEQSNVVEAKTSPDPYVNNTDEDDGDDEVSNAQG